MRFRCIHRYGSSTNSVVLCRPMVKVRLASHPRGEHRLTLADATEAIQANTLRDDRWWWRVSAPRPGNGRAKVVIDGASPGRMGSPESRHRVPGVGHRGLIPAFDGVVGPSAGRPVRRHARLGRGRERRSHGPVGRSLSAPSATPQRSFNHDPCSPSRWNRVAARGRHGADRPPGGRPRSGRPTRSAPARPSSAPRLPARSRPTACAILAISPLLRLAVAALRRTPGPAQPDRLRRLRRAGRPDPALAGARARRPAAGPAAPGSAHRRAPSSWPCSRRRCCWRSAGPPGGALPALAWWLGWTIPAGPRRRWPCTGCRTGSPCRRRPGPGCCSAWPRSTARARGPGCGPSSAAPGWRCFFASTTLLLGRRGFGLGDAKLALGVGALLGWYGWPVLLFGLVLDLRALRPGRAWRCWPPAGSAGPATCRSARSCCSAPRRRPPAGDLTRPLPVSGVGGVVRGGSGSASLGTGLSGRLARRRSTSAGRAGQQRGDQHGDQGAEQQAATTSCG